MKTPLITITKQVTNKLVIEKSRFICELIPITDEQQAQEYLEQIRIEHPKASHHCYGYVIQTPEQKIEKQSDDGEPAKTAGLPILEILRHENLVNVLAVVTRYFGGTLLGMGGLVRAYTNSVKEALNLAELKEVTLMQGYRLDLPYSLYSQVAYQIKQKAIYVVDTQFAEGVTITLYTELSTFISDLEKINPNLIKISELNKIYH
jgi:uncharacterized YigZ family protein